MEKGGGARRNELGTRLLSRTGGDQRKARFRMKKDRTRYWADRNEQKMLMGRDSKIPLGEWRVAREGGQKKGVGGDYERGGSKQKGGGFSRGSDNGGQKQTTPAQIKGASLRKTKGNQTPI